MMQRAIIDISEYTQLIPLTRQGGRRSCEGTVRVEATRESPDHYWIVQIDGQPHVVEAEDAECVVVVGTIEEVLDPRSIREKFDEIDQAIAQLHHLVEDHQNQLNGLGYRCDGTDEQLSTLRTSLNRAENEVHWRFRELENRISDLERRTV